jgi:hypothetical protein
MSFTGGRAASGSGGRGGCFVGLGVAWGFAGFVPSNNCWGRGLFRVWLCFLLAVSVI